MQNLGETNKWEEKIKSRILMKNLIKNKKIDEKTKNVIKSKNYE